MCSSVLNALAFSALWEREGDVPLVVVPGRGGCIDGKMLCYPRKGKNRSR